MTKSRFSAGLLMCRRGSAGIELLLAHPGGPFFARRDEGWWTLPKGIVEEGEDALDAARREFEEETGFTTQGARFHPLGEVRQSNGKRVLAWAFLGDCDPAQLRSNLFEMEWPPRSGRRQSFPEIDRVHWFAPEPARHKILPAQLPLLERAEGWLSG